MSADRFDYVLIGGGVASVNAAIGIRELDESGSILIVCGETYPPYDRPPLSKKMLTDPSLPLDEPESKFSHFYSTNRIDVRSGVACTAIDRDRRLVTLADGSAIGYGKLLVATGARAVAPNVPGTNRIGVQTFRSMDDMVTLRERAALGGSAIVVGAGYLGAEIAAALTERGMSVTLVEQGPTPWSKFSSPEVGAYLASVLQSRGVRLVPDASVVEVTQSGAKLSTGEEVAGSTIIFAIGATPNVELARSAGLAVDPVHGIVVDSQLRTTDPTIWAAGDVAGIPVSASKTPWHAEHHLHAKWEGLHAGKCMAGFDGSFDEVPYFWTDLWEDHMIVRGIPDLGRPDRVFGSIEKGEFCQVYASSDGRVVAGLAMSHIEPQLDGISTNLERLIKLGEKVANLDENEVGLEPRA